MTVPTIGAWNPGLGPGVVGTASRMATIEGIVRRGDPGCDIVELRLDPLLPEGGEHWAGACRALNQVGISLILTLRHQSEGGQWSGGNAQRMDLLQQARFWVGGVDVEILRDAVTPAVEGLPGVTVIGSFHDFDATPPEDVLDALVRRGVDAGAHIVKIASWLDDQASLVRLEALLTRHPDVNLALVGMGPLGPESRIQLPRAGSCLTYGFLDDAVAPGQVSAAHLRKVLG